MQGRIIGFGELLLRLTPPGKRLIVQSQSLDIEVGGAEANVLAGLAALGHSTAMISRVADNPLGDLAMATLAARGIATDAIGRTAGRMGLYFLEPGQGARASAITYDRAGSAFALAQPDDFDFDAALSGARLLHLSGITPALGPAGAAAALTAVRKARAAGVAVSFDGNYRAQLWQAWDSDPRSVLTELIGQADILFGNHRDISLITGRSFSGDGEDRRREAAEAAFALCPNLKLIASTARHVVDADTNRIAARIDLPDAAHQTDEQAVGGIVDRIGTGDAFAAGCLHAWLNGDDAQTIAETGLAMTVLKHSIPGDMPIIAPALLAAYRSGERDVRR
ncbi:sugar kinase [Sphingomonas sp. BGYR3]|uniref:sugar kinase n=1 Tax=Sphingomonas sp. BGYR3 TaxID=2975483 RepID=UPI0021A8ADA2|nr:sugar kinase [Sphingomonas sp. BGYR3]MDG5488553.1 sugar kinase [Sphingomonas sp. BGYR3]